jgi:predicted phosphatase
MSEHRYILEPYKGINTRFNCPNCQRKEFARYIDTQTGSYIHSTVGRCNRESSCGYHYTPKQYFQDNIISFDTPQIRLQSKSITPKQKSISFITVEAFKSSLKGYENNNFIDFLTSIFDIEIATQLISKYFIGTSRHWPGSTVFWQIDISGKIRTGKIMLYSAVTGKRVKEPFNHITWVHKALKLASFELKQCFFGEHLLKDKRKPVAIVESEKTAVIASVYLPQFIWLAVGSINNLKSDKCQVLSSRRVTLFPDLNGFEKWSAMAKELSHLASFNVSELLEHKATEIEREQGLDLADYLLRFYYKEFIEPEPVETAEFAELSKIINPFNIKDCEPFMGYNKTDKPTLKNWQPEISELEHFFDAVKLPDAAIRLDNFRTIIDTSKYIKSHLDIVKAQSGKECYLSYLERLKEFERYLRKYLN